jgi:peroxiredoxin
MEYEYNSPHHRVIPLSYDNADIQPALRVGSKAPDFQLPSVDGGVVRLSEETAKNHVVLVFGSITGPLAATHLPTLNRMYEYFRWRGVQFLFIYTGESHPGSSYPRHTSLEQKTARAREIKELEEIRFPVLVDHLDGSVHRAYGDRPNSSFVVNRDGRLVYRTAMTEPPNLWEYLTHLLLWDDVKAQKLPTHVQYIEQMRFQIPDGPLHRKVIARAGDDAMEDAEAKHPDVIRQA